MPVPERTAKTWKLQVIVGRGVAVYGLFVFFDTFATTQGRTSESLIAAVPYLVTGTILGWFGRFGAYWFHG